MKPGFTVRFISLTTLAMSLNACGPLKDMADMKHTTSDMNKTTGEMNKTTAHMSQTTDGMAGTTDKMAKITEKMSDNTDKMLARTTEMLQTMKGMDSNMVGMRGEMKDMAGDIKIMLGTMNTMNKSIEGMHNDMTLMVTSITTMNKTMEGMYTTMKDMGGDMKQLLGEMKGMKDAITAMVGYMETMVATMKTMDANMSELKVLMQGMSGDTKELVGRMKDMNDEIIGMHTDMSALLVAMGKMGQVMDTMNSSMGDMKADTHQMATKMDAMNESINGMSTLMKTLNGQMTILVGKMTVLGSDIKVTNKTMGVMNQTLNLTRNDLATIFTAEHRINALNQMEKAEDPLTKMGYAAEYMVSNTYQSWNHLTDTAENRKKIQGSDVEEFFQKVKGYIKNTNHANPIYLDKNLVAIAAALHYNNYIEAKGIFNSDEKLISMYSMIADGLRAGKDIKSGKRKLSDLAAYEKAVLAAEQNAIYLLRVRTNALKGVATTILLTKEKNGKPDLAKIAKAAILPFSWKPVRQTMNPEELVKLSECVEWANETERLLNELGIPTIDDGIVNRALGNADISELKSPNGQRELQRLHDALSDFKSFRR